MHVVMYSVKNGTCDNFTMYSTHMAREGIEQTMVNKI